MRRALRGDGGVVGLVGGVAAGELDHLPDEAAPLGRGQSVAVHDGGELTGPVGRRRQLLETRHDVVVQLGVEPA
jgi:hypothetical protein